MNDNDFENNDNDFENSDDQHHDLALNRRNTLKIIATTAALPVIGCGADKQPPPEAKAVQDTPAAAPPSPVIQTGPRRTLTDPDMNNPSVHWDRVLEENELRTLKAMCDLIIPADEVSPGAGSLGAQHYINEYVSAPYDGCKRDLITVRGGIVWINSESQRRFNRVFADLDTSRQTAICDDIKWEKSAKPAYRAGAGFFAKVRDLAATAFYTTEEGMADIGYLGNKPLAAFDGPPVEVLKKLGLA